MSIARPHLVARIALAFTLSAAAALASDHLVQIHKVVGGVNGDSEIQAIQFRMRAANQNQFQNSKVWAYDANGENPVLIIDFDRSVPSSNLGDTVLIASADFRRATVPPAQADFTMTSLIPGSYFAAGGITLENDAGTQVWWRLSWGGANYTGTTTGSTANDPDGDFGPPFPEPLPSDGTRALEFQGPAPAFSTTNAKDYALSPRNAVLTNNAGETFTICSDTVCGDLNCDGIVNGGDLDPFFDALAAPAAWQVAHPNCALICVADINNDGRVDGGDIDPFFLVLGGGCRR